MHRGRRGGVGSEGESQSESESESESSGVTTHPDPHNQHPTSNSYTSFSLMALDTASVWECTCSFS